jgi:hypothetical protein
MKTKQPRALSKKAPTGGGKLEKAGALTPGLTPKHQGPSSVTQKLRGHRVTKSVSAVSISLKRDTKTTEIEPNVRPHWIKRFWSLVKRPLEYLYGILTFKSS